MPIPRALISVSDKTGLVGVRALPGRPRRRDPVDRRHRQGAGRCRAQGDRGIRPHRLSRDHGRTGQDAAPQDPWRHPGAARRQVPRRGDGRARHRADRSGGGEPLPVRGDGGEGRRFRHLRREHRHRRAGADPRRGEEPRVRHRRRRSRGLRAGDGRDGRVQRRHHAGAAPAAGRHRLCPHRGLRRGDFARGSRNRRGTSSRAASPSRDVSRQALRYGENPHQAAAFYKTGDARPGVASAHSSRARSSATTTSTTPTRRSSWWPNSTSRAVAIIKHANPCGVAVGATLAEAYTRRWPAIR